MNTQKELLEQAKQIEKNIVEDEKMYLEIVPEKEYSPEAWESMYCEVI